MSRSCSLLVQSLSEESLELEDEDDDDLCFLFFSLCLWCFPCSFLFLLLFFLWLCFFFVLFSFSSDEELDLLCFFLFFLSSSPDEEWDLGEGNLYDEGKIICLLVTQNKYTDQKPKITFFLTFCLCSSFVFVSFYFLR